MPPMDGQVITAPGWIGRDSSPLETGHPRVSGAGSGLLPGAAVGVRGDGEEAAVRTGLAVATLQLLTSVAVVVQPRAVLVGPPQHHAFPGSERRPLCLLTARPTTKTPLWICSSTPDAGS